MVRPAGSRGVRLASATTSSQAFGIAETMAGDDLTAWVFETEPRLGRRNRRRTQQKQQQHHGNTGHRRVH